MDIIYGARVGEELDSEDVCWPTQQAYIYVYNGCSQPVNVTILVRPCLLKRPRVNDLRAMPCRRMVVPHCDACLCDHLGAAVSIRPPCPFP